MNDIISSNKRLLVNDFIQFFSIFASDPDQCSTYYSRLLIVLNIKQVAASTLRSALSLLSPLLSLSPLLILAF